MRCWSMTRTSPACTGWLACFDVLCLLCWLALRARWLVFCREHMPSAVLQPCAPRRRPLPHPLMKNCLACRRRLYARYLGRVVTDFELSVRRTPVPLATIRSEVRRCTWPAEGRGTGAGAGGATWMLGASSMIGEGAVHGAAAAPIPHPVSCQPCQPCQPCATAHASNNTRRTRSCGRGSRRAAGRRWAWRLTLPRSRRPWIRTSRASPAPR